MRLPIRYAGSTNGHWSCCQDSTRRRGRKRAVPLQPLCIGGFAIDATPAASLCYPCGHALRHPAPTHLALLEGEPMRPLRYSINVTLDGCCDHLAVPANEELHRHAAKGLAEADALLFGRVTYEMMESAWRPTADGGWPDWMAPWMVPFAETIDAADKYVVSSTLESVDWNAQLIEGDLATAVEQLKQQPGNGIMTGGVQLPLALADLGLIDEYEIIVHPRIVGRGPALLAGLAQPVDVTLVNQTALDSGAVALTYVPTT